jgi:hypothetical protein
MIPQKGKNKGGFLLDSWWSDGKEVAFFGVKVPPENESMMIVVSNMKSLKQNQQWF